jgi:hypothetical protein
VLCGRADHLEDHHVGGRNHAPTFTQPVCQLEHAKLHKNIAQAGVNLSATTNPKRRRKQALRATLCFLWELSEHLEE